MDEYFQHDQLEKLQEFGVPTIESLKKEIILDWHYCQNISELDNSLNFLRDHGGVYLWIYKSTPYRIAYIGEAQKFSTRFHQHLNCLVGGSYSCIYASPNEDYLDILDVFYAGKRAKDIIATEKEHDEQRVFLSVNSANESFSFSRIADPDSNLFLLKHLNQFAFAFAPLKTQEMECRLDIESVFLDTIWRGYGAIKGFDLHTYSSFRFLGHNVRTSPFGRISQDPKFYGYTFKHQGDTQKLPPEITKIFDDTKTRWSKG